MTLNGRGNECKLHCLDKQGERCHGMIGCQGTVVTVAVPDADEPSGLKILGQVRGRQGILDLIRQMAADRGDDQ